MINDKNIKKITIAKTPESFIVEWEYISPLRDDEGETSGGATECKNGIEVLSLLCDMDTDFQELQLQTISLRIPDGDYTPLRDFIKKKGITRQTAYEWKKRGYLEFLKIKGNVFVKQLVTEIVTPL